MADEPLAANAPPIGSLPNAPISSDPTPPPPAPPAAFDWKTAGLNDLDLAAVTTKGWKGPGDVVAGYRNLETAVGVPPERLIKLPAPKDAADPKVWQDIYTKLGRPETADKYVIPVPEGDKGEFAATMKPILHKAGLSQSQVTSLTTEWNALTAAQQQSKQAAIESRNVTEVSDLKQAWGTDYEARAALVDRAATTFGIKQDQLDALKGVLGPKQAMEFLYQIGSQIAVEDRTVPGMNGTTGFAMSPDAAAAKIVAMKTDPNFAALFNSKDPKQRMEARAEMDKLHRIAYPGSTVVGATR